MATVGYKYIKTTHVELLKCVKYLQNLYQLRDWKIRLDTSFKLPKEFMGDSSEDYDARTNISDDELHALIWLSLVRAKENDENPHESLTHEMTHLVIARCGSKSEKEDEDELLTRVLSPIVYRLMCTEMKIKIGEIK